MSEIRVGDWVAAKGLVVNIRPGLDEYEIRFRSHNEDYVGPVRMDSCEPTSPPGWVPRCPSLYADVDVEEALFRCKHFHEHAGRHENGHRSWDDAAEYGNVEES